jgi:hypothetical protein
MEINVDYPIHVIWRDGGYHCLEGEDVQGKPTMGLMIFSDAGKAEHYIQSRHFDASVKSFHNAFQFRRFLFGLNEPKPEIVCDAVKDERGNYEMAWCAEVGTLLDEVLPPVAFLWEYPLFVIRVGAGYSSIDGTKATGERVLLVAVFTDTDLAESYMQKAEVDGSIETIPNDPVFWAFVNNLLPPSNGVIFDPTTALAGSIGKVCIDKATLLSNMSPG